jgi:hypothetical protein
MENWTPVLEFFLFALDNCRSRVDKESDDDWDNDADWY